jgi:hypothetical protein
LKEKLVEENAEQEIFLFKWVYCIQESCRITFCNVGCNRCECCDCCETKKPQQNATKIPIFRSPLQFKLTMNFFFSTFIFFAIIIYIAVFGDSGDIGYFLFNSVLSTINCASSVAVIRNYDYSITGILNDHLQKLIELIYEDEYKIKEHHKKIIGKVDSFLKNDNNDEYKDDDSAALINVKNTIENLTLMQELKTKICQQNDPQEQKKIEEFKKDLIDDFVVGHSNIFRDLRTMHSLIISVLGIVAALFALKK